MNPDNPMIDHETHAREEILSGLNPMSLEYWQWLTYLCRERESRKDWRPEDIADLY